MKTHTFTGRESGLKSNSKKELSVQKRLKPWWFVSECGNRTNELAKGKPGVEVASAEDLVKALGSINAAVKAGELNSQIEKASCSLRSGFGS